MSYYQNQTAPKGIEVFLNTNPTEIQHFFEHYEFMGELRGQNQRLSEYLKNNLYLLENALRYVTVPPLESDDASKKYKYPLMTVQMIQLENTTIVECFFQDYSSKPLLAKLFSSVLNQTQEMLPLLASYIQRIAKCLLKLRQFQMLEYVYQNPQILRGLTTHSYNNSIELLLQAFMNVQYLKDKPSESRLETRLSIIKIVVAQFKQNLESEKGNNLGDFLIDVIERHHLVGDGKRMLDQILCQQNLQLLFSNIEVQTIARVLKAITNYYCMSILNSQQPQNLENKKNLMILQSESFVGILCSFISRMIKFDFSYKTFRIMQIICHSICIRSHQILKSLIKSRFFQSMFELFFNIQASIFHSLTQKTMAHIFYSQKQVYEHYRIHILQNMDIIKVIGSKITDFQYNQFMSKHYAGYLISIIKICLKEKGAQETIQRNMSVIQKIAAVIRIYDERVKKDMGSYLLEDNNKPTEYLITKTSSNSGKQTIKSEDIVVKKESREPLLQLLSMTTLSQSIQQLPETNTVKPFQEQLSEQSKQIIKEQSTVLNDPSQIKILEYQTQKSNQEKQNVVISQIVQSPSLKISAKKQITIQIPSTQKPVQQQINTPTSFQQYMKVASKQAQETIRLRRSSMERQSTPVSKGLSPNKIKKLWTDSSVEKNPMKNSGAYSKDLHNIKIKISKSPPKPSESKRFRVMESKDIPLLSFLGIIKTDK